MSRMHFGVAVAMSALAGALLLGEPAHASATVYTPPTTISTDCSRDVSSELSAFLSSVPDGATVLLQSHACYRIEREIRVTGKSDWSLDGQGTTFRRTQLSPLELQYPNGANAMLRFVNLTNSTIKDLSIAGVNTTSDVRRPAFGSWELPFCFEHGIVLLGAQNVTVRDVSIDGVFGDGVYIGKSDLNGPSRSIDLHNLFIDRNGRQGIGITSADGVVVDGVVIAHSRRAGIDMEPHPGDVVENVTIQNSSIGSWLMAISAGGVGLVNDVDVRGNTFIRSALPLVYDRAHSAGSGDRRRNWRVAGNVVDFVVRSSSAILMFTNTSKVDVEKNSATLNPGSGLAAWVGSRAEARFECNHFPGAIEGYVKVDSTSSAVLLNNSITSAAPVCSSPIATPAASPAASTPPATHTSSPTATTRPPTNHPSATGNPRGETPTTPSGAASSTGSPSPGKPRAEAPYSPSAATSSGSASNSSPTSNPPAKSVTTPLHVNKKPTIRHKAHRRSTPAGFKNCARLTAKHAVRVCKRASRQAAVACRASTHRDCRIAVRTSLDRCQDLRLQRHVRVCTSVTKGVPGWKHYARHKAQDGGQHSVQTVQLSATTQPGRGSRPSSTDVGLLAMILAVLFGSARRILSW